jgi:hypothetical protein
MIVPNQENLKVHFAGAEVLLHTLCQKEAKVKYSLFTVYPFIKGKKNLSDIKYSHIPNIIENEFEHVIMDSGLFTLMFGSEKGEKSEKFLSYWTDCILRFMDESKYKGTYVEVDCQKVLGVEQAWKFREHLKKNSNNRQINVFHFEDGQKGLDRMIEYSDYIALSIPELRILKKKDYTYRLACYIKNKKPDIDIHLLGCTEYSLLEKCSFCSSSDSTSWMQPMRYGGFDLMSGKKSIKQLNKDKIIKKYYNQIKQWTEYQGVNNITDKGFFNYACSIFQCEILKNKYGRAAGNQN